jgi:hypothetical protein
VDTNVFNEIWDSIVKLEINRAASIGSKTGKSIKLFRDEKQSKDLLFSRYLAEKAEFKRKAMLKPDDLIDRHKIAALFYVAFVYRTDRHEFPFIVFDHNYRRQLDADTAVTHSIAFDVSLGILESFILSDPNTSADFKNFIGKNGLTEPQIICRGELGDGYEKQTIKQLIFAQNENKLSVALLANIFYSIENNSRLYMATNGA